ncbi:hypothetical protein HYC85_000341 [Camellia sinensis]|uniref:Glycosyl transferase 64 domain-containing protein n=1 Tax=Camellia sinensis TaxID=4442 RepID=A0A7J7I263_CAMSI|nr:hypothetical protein HYC85_000341 [Camellia sinensis]
MTSALIAIRDAAAAVDSDGLYSPAKEKAANNRGVYSGRSPLLHRRLRQLLDGPRVKLLLFLCLLCLLVLFASRLDSLIGWNPHYPSFVSSPCSTREACVSTIEGENACLRQLPWPRCLCLLLVLLFYNVLIYEARTLQNRHRSGVGHGGTGGYTVLINTWKRNSLLKQSVAHYASCGGTDAIHVVWSESDPPSHSLKAYLNNIVLSKSQTSQKTNFKFDINKEDNLNKRFKPIEDLRTNAIFSVDDDVIVPCRTLDFAFAVWQTAPFTMVGFVPRMHWLDQEVLFWGGNSRTRSAEDEAEADFLRSTDTSTKKNGITYFKYEGWWSVWWMGTYSMVLSKAAFFHRKYLDLYTHKMPSSIYDYITRERSCEDIAMSLLIANATDAPPIWVKGKIYEIGSSGISSLIGHSKRRNKCLNDFISLYGTMPLVPTNVKAVDARHEWFW